MGRKDELSHHNVCDSRLIQDESREEYAFLRAVSPEVWPEQLGPLFFFVLPFSAHVFLCSFSAALTSLQRVLPGIAS